MPKFTSQNLVKVLSDVHEATVDMSSKGNPFIAALDATMPRVEWHLIIDGR